MIIRNIQDLVRLKQAYQTVFKPSGDAEIVLRHLIKMGCVNRTTFCPGDPNKTMMNEGARRLVLEALNLIHGDADAVINRINQTYREDKE